MSDLRLSAEQAAVYETIENTRENVFVTGRAGTGKSTLLNHLAWNTSKQLVICAPDRGRRPERRRTDDPLAVPAADRRDRGPRDRTERRPPQAAQHHRHPRDRRGVDGQRRPAGRDRPQPAPGEAAAARRPSAACSSCCSATRTSSRRCRGDADERAYFADHYRSMWFFDAKVWQEADLRIFELTTIHRQHEEEFKAMLNAVRHGARHRRDRRRDSTTTGARPAADRRRRSPSPPATTPSTASTRPRSRSCPGASLTARGRDQRRLRRARLPGR